MKFILLIALIIVIGCSAEKEVEVGNKSDVKKNQLTECATEDTIGQKVESKKKILFFMNPMGRPCQMQDEILNGMGDEFKKMAEIVYIKTTEPSARDAFYKYGVRSLPSLIIEDGNGKIIKRFSPGIQSKQSIYAAVSIEG